MSRENMDLAELQKNWDEFGRVDPLWAILTWPEKRRGKWATSEFFQTGIEEIGQLFRCIESLGVRLQKRTALDFGCGVGRLTQALSPHFDKCHGVDIAPSMIELARKYNQYGTKCEYHVNETDGLPLFENESFDLVYSKIVLQHMRPEYATNYVREFVRLLAAGGILAFQLPSEALAPQLYTDTEVLPDSAFRAKISPRYSVLPATIGSRISIMATVANLSSFSWPSDSVVLGDHWLNPRRETVIRDDARASLPRDLKPGDEIELTIEVTAPQEPGSYFLQLDMVQEHVAWFADKGSQVAEIRASITPKRDVAGHRASPHAARWEGPARDDRAPQLPVAVPTMEMYNVPKSTVVDVIIEAGGELLEARPDDSAGPGWTSFLYFVTKRR